MAISAIVLDVTRAPSVSPSSRQAEDCGFRSRSRDRRHAHWLFLVVALATEVGCGDGTGRDTSSPPSSSGDAAVRDAPGQRSDGRVAAVPSILDIWGTGPSDVWMAGFSGSLLHWDGVRWKSVESHLRGHLVALSGAGGGQLWVVEEQRLDGGRTRRVLRGDGSTFQPVDIGAQPGELPRAFWHNGDNDVWLVGYAGDGLDDGYGIARHFDGVTWSFAAGELGGTLSAAWGTSREMFFVGSTSGGYVAHWIDGQWSAAAYPVPILLGVWGFGARDVWAVGTVDRIFHYDGTEWAEVDGGTNDASTVLMDVWGASPEDIWAVGYHGFSGMPAKGTLLHWDGSRWSASPDAPLEPLDAIWGSGKDDIWAAGSGALLHFASGQWSRITANDLQ